MGRRNHKSCRRGCGDACSQEPPNRSDNQTFTEVVERALSRRAFLAAASEEPPVGPYRPNPTGCRLAFTPIARPEDIQTNPVTGRVYVTSPTTRPAVVTIWRSVHGDPTIGQ